MKRYLTVRLPIVNSLDSSSRYHEVERYCRLVAKGLSKKSLNGGRLKFFDLARPSGPPRLSAPVGFQWAEKWLQGGWPEELLLTLVEQLPGDAKIFVSPSEEGRACEILPESRRHKLVCKASLTDYAREVASCSYLISIDTGAVHVAAAMGVPVIDVFPQDGAHHTVPRWRPWMTPHRVVLKPPYENGESISALVQKISSAEADLTRIVEGLAS